MRTKGKSRWKGLLLVIGVCVATLVGMSAYAFSLEEWGAARTMIFNLGGMLLIGAALVALVLLISWEASDAGLTANLAQSFAPYRPAPQDALPDGAPNGGRRRRLVRFRSKECRPRMLEPGR